jgi:RHS repeat-associated protein
LSADNSVLNYCYRADGGKFSALDADKTGLIYIGSLVYKQTAGSKIEFESAAFSDGRFRRNTHRWNTNYAPEYYLKDHLGSPRAFVDWSGELIALRDYYAFGKSWLKPNSPTTSDLSRFNGKEEQTVGGAGLLDYGARFYHPDLGRWLTQDPLAQQYAGVSPYNFCLNNPIRYTDPFGLSPQSSRQVEVKDRYFNYDGVYLGRDDNRRSNKIRIISDEQWSRLDPDGDGVISYEYGVKNSVLFSKGSLSMEDEAIVRVYEWVSNYYNIGFPILSLSYYLDNGVLMETKAQVHVDKFTGKVIKNEADYLGLFINHTIQGMLQYNFCDDIENIMSVYSHEDIHKTDWITNAIETYSWGKYGQELHAHTRQIFGNPYWSLTTPVFRDFIWYNYMHLKELYEEN